MTIIENLERQSEIYKLLNANLQKGLFLEIERTKADVKEFNDLCLEDKKLSSLLPSFECKKCGFVHSVKEHSKHCNCILFKN